jgi:hypothetical protein
MSDSEMHECYEIQDDIQERDDFEIENISPERK